MTLTAEDGMHAYDPVRQNEYFESVLGRRIIAFFIDAALIFVLTIAVYVFLLIAGIFTFGLAWLLFGLAFPAVALGYCAHTLSRPQSATPGMRAVGLQMRTWYGSRMYALLGAFHALVFYFSIVLFTPLVLLVALFNERRRCLHDFLAGTVVINAEDRVITTRK